MGAYYPRAAFFINYSQGTLRFINRTPSPQDQIVVEYDYFLDNGGTVAGNTVTGVACRSVRTTKDQLSRAGMLKRSTLIFAYRQYCRKKAPFLGRVASPGVYG